jgi:hypothetical protein
MLAGGAGQLVAQDWGWGDSGSDQRQPYGGPGYGQRPVYGQSGYGQGSMGNSSNPRCRELEMQLSGGSMPGSADQLPKIDADMRQADADFRAAQGEADRARCYDDMFLFGRSLRRTPPCIDLDSRVQAAKATLSQLKAQRDAITRGTSPRGRRDEILAELARNRCGDQYAHEHDSHRSLSSSIVSFFTSEEDSGDSWHASQSSWFGGSGGSAFRTLCVRECDGFYFPISTGTSESKFAEDEAKCHTQCAAPAGLFYHRVDQDVEQMVSLRGVPYSQMPFAFRNRKVYIKGCSCNASEYSREEIAKSEELLKTSKRADASAGAGKTTAAGSDSAFARRINQAVQSAPAQPQGQPPQQQQPQPQAQQPEAQQPGAAQPAAGGAVPANPGWAPESQAPAANPPQ